MTIKTKIACVIAICALVFGTWYFIRLPDKVTAPPELTLKSTDTGKIQNIEFITWTDAEKKIWNESYLRTRFGTPAKIKPGINFLHVSKKLNGTSLKDSKKYIEPNAENMLLFIFRNGEFVGEKTGPYTTSNIETDINNIALKTGEGVIVIAQADSSAYGFFNDTKPAKNITTLEAGWNLVALTDDELENLPYATKSDEIDVWLKTVGRSGTFKEAKKVLKKRKGATTGRKKYVTWVNNKSVKSTPQEENFSKSLLDRLVPHSKLVKKIDKPNITPSTPTQTSRPAPPPIIMPRLSPAPSATTSTPAPRSPAGPVLTLIVEVINNDAGRASKNDFHIFINNKRVTSGLPNTIAMGVYHVRAKILTGYTASGWKGDCKSGGTVTLINGETKTCVITMDDITRSSSDPPPLLSPASTVVTTLLPQAPLPYASKAELLDLSITQSGLITRTVPMLPLIAGKATLIKGTVSIPQPSGARITQAHLDIIRQDTGKTVQSVQGYAFASNNTTLVEQIGTSEDVHFFIPGNVLSQEQKYKFIYRLKSGRNLFTKTAFRDIQFRKNNGIAFVLISVDQGLPNNASALLRDVLTQTARILPVKAGSGSVLPVSAQKKEGPGIRYEYVEKIAVPRSTTTDFEQEFILRDMKVGVGPSPSGNRCTADVASETWNGPFLALNTTYPEDINRNGTFDENELAKCRMQGDPATWPMLRRFNNFLRFMLQQIEEKRTYVAAVRRSENIPYGMILISGGLSGQNRNTQLFGSTTWATLDVNATTTLPRELVHTLGIFPTQAEEELQGPAYNLELKRRIVRPINLLHQNRHPLQDAFLADSDYDAVLQKVSEGS